MCKAMEECWKIREKGKTRMSKAMEEMLERCAREGRKEVRKEIEMIEYTKTAV